MHTFKQIISLMLCVLMLTGLFASCSNAESIDQGGSETSTEASTTPDAGDQQNADESKETSAATDIIVSDVNPLLQINEETNFLEISYDKGATWTSLNVTTTAQTQNGIKPIFKLDIETNTLLVSYDNGTTWAPLNAAEGIKGEQGEKGEQGDKGDKGDKGNTGATGATGATGVSIINVYVDSNYHLWVEFSNGTKKDAGYVGVTESGGSGNQPGGSTPSTPSIDPPSTALRLSIQ